MPAWIGYDFGIGNKKTIQKYTIVTADENSFYSPKSWEFQGSNDGTNWETIHSVTNEPEWSDGEKREYTFSNNESYSQYRLLFYSNYNPTFPNTLIIDEIEMMEAVSSEPLDQLQNGNTIAEIETGLTNLTITDETFLDFAFDLATTDSSVKPSIDQISVSYEGIFNFAPNDPVINNHNSGTFITNTSPILNFDLEDTDTGDTVKYQIQIDNNSNFSSPVIDFTELSSTSAVRTGVEYTASLGNGQWYWRVRGIDSEGLQSDWSEATNGFFIDTILPASQIKFPGNHGQHFKNIPIIIGGAEDTNGSGLANTLISIKDNVIGKYYDGSAFVNDTETWLTTTGSTIWSYPAPTWMDMRSYTIRSRATDNAGNQEHTDSATFTYDTTNGMEGSLYVSNPAYMNNSDYEIFYPVSTPIPNNGEVWVDFPEEFTFSSWMEAADIEVISNTPGEISSSITTIDRAEKKLTTVISGSGLIAGSILTISIDNLRIHNPSVKGDYDVEINTYGV